jgi:hypothetical protein
MMSNKVEQYLLSKRNAWSESTLKNARPMLLAYGADILSLTPEQFYDSLAALGDYSKKTLFIMAAGYYAFCFPQVPNPFTAFRKDNRNVFKHAYKKKTVGTSYAAVKAALEGHDDIAFRTKALHLLSSAQRWTESATSDGSGSITGKGGKQRSDFGHGVLSSSIGYATFRRRLADCCGITPHALRKLALTRAASRGATAADLCAIAGWSSIATAISYLQPQEKERLASFLGE